MTTTFTAEDYPLLEPGVYQALFDRLEEPDEVGQYGPYLNWYFTATTPDGPVEVMGRSSKPDFFTRSTKARQWHEAILGRDLSKGEVADPTALRGTRVALTVDIVKTERGDERNRIVSIRRTKAAEVASATVDPEYQAWLAEQETKKAAVGIADAGDHSTSSEPSAEVPS